MNNSLFRKASIDRISSPEQLNDYIKVSNPGIWMILIALCVLLVAGLVWSVTGSLPTNVSTSGFMRDGQAVCYLSTEDSAKIKVGQTVTLQAIGSNSSFDGKVLDVGTIPLSPSEVTSEINSDYLTDIILTENYSVRIIIAVSQTSITDDTVLNLKIVVDEKRPFDFLTN